MYNKAKILAHIASSKVVRMATWLGFNGFHSTQKVVAMN